MNDVCIPGGFYLSMQLESQCSAFETIPLVYVCYIALSSPTQFKLQWSDID